LGIILKNSLIVHLSTDKTPKREMRKMDRSKALILLSLVTVAAILGSMALTERIQRGG